VALSLQHDIRLALRVFRQHDGGFPLAVVLTLASGIAACTVIFAIVNAVLYARYDVYREPHRLLAIWEQNPRLGAVGAASPRNVADWQAGAASLERIGTFEPATYTLTGDGEPEALQGGAITPDLLALLDARAELGRLFAAAERSVGNPRVLLLSHGLWQRRYGGRRDIVGRSVLLNGSPSTVVGVLDEAFRLAPFAGPEPELVVPAGDAMLAARSRRTALVVARLRPGVTTAQARTEIQAIAARTERSDPDSRGWGVLVLNPMEFDLQGDGQFLLVLAVAVSFVMLIVCANVTGLLLSRGASRAREVATRLALGASRLRVARQFLAEAAALGLAGGVAGVFAAYWACAALTWWISGTAIGQFRFVLDARVLSVAAALSLGCALLVGALPAMQLSRNSLMSALREAGGPALGSGRLRAALVVGEVVLASVLLAGAGLVLQGVANLRHIDPGFRADAVATQRIVLPDARYPSAAARAAFADRLLARVAVPSSRRWVSIASHLPAVGGDPPVVGFTPERPGPSRSGRAPSARVISASAGYFETMQIGLRSGRAFSGSDLPGSLPVAIVSEGLARRWLADGSPVGTRLLVEDEWRTIVGVAADVRNFHMNVAPAPAIYVPYSQRPVTTTVIVSRIADGDPLAFAGAIRRELRSIDPDVPIRTPRLLRDAIEQSMGGFDMTRLLVAALAGAALLLAAVGIYGVIACSVIRRTREIGIRIALGAGPRRIERQVLREALHIGLLGGLPGLALALATGRLLSAKLHGVRAADPVILASVIGLVTATVLLASWLPARRAARVAPAVTLRHE
jgi:predicted permease